MGFPWPFLATVGSFSFVLLINKIIFSHTHREDDLDHHQEHKKQNVSRVVNKGMDIVVKIDDEEELNFKRNKSRVG